MEKKRSNNAEFGLATVFAIFMFVVLWFPPPPSRLSLDKFVLRVCNLVTVKNGRALRLETDASHEMEEIETIFDLF